MTTPVAAGFVFIAVLALCGISWGYALDRAFSRQELAIARLRKAVTRLDRRLNALAAHHGLEINDPDDDSPTALAAVSDETQPIPAQPQPDDGPPTMPDLKKASAVPPPVAVEPNWVEAELADIRARSGRRNTQRPTAKESK